MNVEYIVSLKDKFTPAAKKMNGAIQKTDKSVNHLNKTAKKTGGNLKKMLVSGALLMGAFRIAKSSLTAWDKQAQAVAQVRQGLISTKNVSGKTLTQLQKQASYLQKHSLFGDEDILQGVTAQILTFTNITGKAFDRTQQAALDLSARMKVDLKSATIQLGKALNDPVKNLSMLSRSGIQFTEQQKTQIDTLWKSGKKVEAQTIILDELQKEFGGSAQAAALAGLGPLKQLQMKLGDLKELLGGLLFKVIKKMLPFFDKMLKGIKGFFDYLDSKSSVLGKISKSFFAIFNAFASIGKSIFTIFKNLFGSFAGGGSMLDGILKIIQSIQKILVPLLLWVSKAIGKLFNPVIPILSKLFPIFKKIFIDIFVAAKNIFSSFTTNISGFSNILIGIVKMLIQKFNFIENILRTAILPIIGNIIDILKGVFTQLEPILTHIWSIIKSSYTIVFAIGKIIFTIVALLVKWIKLFMNSGIGKFIIKTILSPIKLIINLLDKFLKGVAKLAKLAGLDFSIGTTKSVNDKNIVGKFVKGTNTTNPLTNVANAPLPATPLTAGGVPKSSTTSVGTPKPSGGTITKIEIQKLVETINIEAKNISESKEQIKKIVIEALTEGLNDVILVTK